MSSCRQQGGVKDLLAEKSTNAASDLTDEQKQSGVLMRVYAPLPGEVLKDCSAELKGLAYVTSNRDVMECQEGQYTKVISQFAFGENLIPGHLFELGFDKKIVQELKIQISGQPTVTACQEKVNFEKQIQYCVPVLRNTDSTSGPFKTIQSCQSAKLFEGVSWPVAGSISVLGPSGAPAIVTCLAKETQAQAIQRGSIVSECPIGSRSAQLGLCTPCAGGTYQDQIGQTTCKACNNQISEALSVSYEVNELGLTTNTCQIIGATCSAGLEFNAEQGVCSPSGVVYCPPGKQESGGTCINCPSGTFKANTGVESCTPCTNNILYGASPVYALSEFGKTSNSCTVSSSSCIAGFTYNSLTKTCEATAFVGSYTEPVPPSNLAACDGSVTVSGSLIGCYNMVGDSVDLSNCPTQGGSQTYQSPAGVIDAESNSLLLGLIKDVTRVSSVQYSCAAGSASQSIEAANFNSLLNNQNLIVNCQNQFADPFLQGVSVSCRSQIKKIAATTSSSCALLENGKLYCWGIQQNGVIGNGVNSTAVYTNATFPRNIVQVCKNVSCTEKLEGVIDVSANTSHTCAIDSQNDAYCWGSNANGRLGDGTTTTKTIATLVSGGFKFTQISTGVNHTCAIESVSKKVICWGLNTNGELGYGAQDGVATNPNGSNLLPTNYVTTSTVSTAHLTDVHQLALGDAFSCAIAGADRRLYCWGRGANGRTGLNTTALRNFASQVKIDYALDIPMSLVYEVSAKSSHACAIVGNTKTLYCWGNGANLRLGNGSVSNQQVPQLITTPEVPKIISLGASSTCISSEQGNVFCVGRNNGGQLGYGSYSPTTGNVDNEKATFQEVQASVALGSEGLFAGIEFYCALDQNRIAHCWGTNTYRQLNDTTTTLRPAPVKMDFF